MKRKRPPAPDFVPYFRNGKSYGMFSKEIAEFFELFDDDPAPLLETPAAGSDLLTTQPSLL